MMTLTNKEFKVVRDNIQKLYEVCNCEDVYLTVKDIVENYKTENKLSDVYMYMYEEATSGEVESTSLLKAFLKEDGTDFVYYTIWIVDECNSCDEIDVKIPLSFLLQENFNWKDCQIKVDGYEKWGSPSTLNIEMYIPKGKEIINNI